MRITNLMILLAIIAGVILVAQYISQLRKSKNGNNFVSGGRVFLNWVLAIVFVVCVGGLVISAFRGGHQEAKTDDKTESVEYTAPKEELAAVSVKFNKKVKLNDNGQAKVEFKISPQTKVTVRGHKSKQVVKTFEASKGTKSVTHSYTFDFPGTYDIIAERDGKKVVKQLKVKDNDSATSSSSQVSSSSVASFSSSSYSSASSVSSDDSDSATQSNSSTATSSNGSATSRRSQRSNNYNVPSSSNNGGGYYSSSNTGNDSSPASTENTGETGINDGPGYSGN